MGEGIFIWEVFYYHFEVCGYHHSVRETPFKESSQDIESGKSVKNVRLKLWTRGSRNHPIPIRGQERLQEGQQ